jgi:NAD-dependent histone deacetylase SIR2
MNTKTKRGAAKGVSLAKSKAKKEAAADKLSDNPTVEELKTAAISVSLADLEERVADVRESWETDSLFEDALEELTFDAATASSGE